MKKLLTLSLAAALAFTFAVGVSADGDVIKKGTAAVDGVLDDAYNYSLALKGLGKGDNIGPCTNDKWDNTASMDVYFMYDDERLYICAVVTDDDVLSKGEEYCKGNNPNANDVIEFKFSMDGTSTVFKVGIDAHGYNLYGLTAHYDLIDYTSMKYATKLTDTGYILEASIPCTKGDLDMIKTGKLGVLWQINDMDADGNVGSSSNFYGGYPATAANTSSPIFYSISSEKAEAPAAAAPSTGTGSTGTAAVAPSTFDPVVIAAVLSAASGAAFVAASRKR